VLITGASSGIGGTPEQLNAAIAGLGEASADLDL
jgi:hypothetical protein